MGMTDIGSDAFNFGKELALTIGRNWPERVTRCVELPLQGLPRTWIPSHAPVCGPGMVCNSDSCSHLPSNLAHQWSLLLSRRQHLAIHFLKGSCTCRQKLGFKSRLYRVAQLMSMLPTCTLTCLNLAHPHAIYYSSTGQVIGLQPGRIYIVQWAWACPSLDLHRMYFVTTTGLCCLGGRIFIVHVPGFFSLLWRIVEPMLAANTRRKIRLLRNQQVIYLKLMRYAPCANLT